MSKLTTWEQAIRTSYQKFLGVTDKEKANIELGFALQIFQGSPTLQKCEPQSIINAVVNVARTNVTLNPVMRLAYLVPRGKQCVLDFSYMGLISMLKDNDCILTIDSHIVYDDEQFSFDKASNTISHSPIFVETESDHNARKIIGCYSRAVLPSKVVVYEFMPMWEIEKVKKSSTNASSKYSAWTTWRDEMIKKTVIKRHFKMLISLSSANNKKLSAILEIENENSPLKNDFNKPSTPNVNTAFIEESEPKDHTYSARTQKLKEIIGTDVEISDADTDKIKAETEQQKEDYLGSEE